MSFPGGIQFTNSGFLLSSKTLIGKQVVFTRLAVGDGELGGQSPLELTSLIHEVESIEINKLLLADGTSALVGGPFSNQGLATGFWWREVGLYALDPDTLAEKLYCYGNAGVLADYIPSGGGAEIIEKQLDYWIMASAAANISAVIDSSLVYASAQDLTDHMGDEAAHGATVTAIAGKMMVRDSGGRVKVADPVDDQDAATLASVKSEISKVFDFDNLSVRYGWSKVTQFDVPSAGAITETLKEGAITMATRVTLFDVPAAGNIQETVTYKGRSFRKVTQFDVPTAGQITETVTEV